MDRIKTAMAIALITLAFQFAGNLGAESRTGTSFMVFDIMLDTGADKLAAYQLEIAYPQKTVKIVGLEGADTGAFNPPPYYDPEGMAGGRIKIAAYTLDDEDAPAGKTRVARMHLSVQGSWDRELEFKLVTAAKPGGEKITPKITITEMAKNEN